MKKEKAQTSFVNIGSASLLVIFLILCLVTFAILSLSSAKSDYSFSERLAVHKTEYYEASSRAEEILDEIDRVLAEQASSCYGDKGSNLPASSLFASYTQEISKVLDESRLQDCLISCETTEESLRISYKVPAGEKQALQVELEVTDPKVQEFYYQVLAWKLVTTQSWEGDQSLHLISLE